MMKLIALTVVPAIMVVVGLVQMFGKEHEFRSDPNLNAVLNSLHDAAGAILFSGGVIAICVIWA